MAISEYYLQNGEKRYRVEPYINGKRANPKAGFKRLKDARAYEASIIARGKAVKRATYNDVEQLYLESYLNDNKESSYYTVSKRLKNKVPERWRKRDISSITTLECQRLANDLASKYKSACSYISTISEVFNFAKNQMEVLDTNPFDKVRKPKKHRPENIPETWNEQEKEAFFDAAKKFRRPEAYPLFALMDETGMRRGEIVAICAEDFLEADLLRVRDNMTIDRNGREIIDTPKTESSERIVALSPWCAGIIHDYMDKYHITQGRLFPIGGNCLRKWLIEIEKIAGVHHNQSHNFRRGHATELINNGAPIQEIQKRLGHKDASTTLSFYIRSNRDKRNVLQYLDHHHATNHAPDNKNG